MDSKFERYLRWGASLGLTASMASLLAIAVTPSSPNQSVSLMLSSSSPPSKPSIFQLPNQIVSLDPFNNTGDKLRSWMDKSEKLWFKPSRNRLTRWSSLTADVTPQTARDDFSACFTLKCAGMTATLMQFGAESDSADVTAFLQRSTASTGRSLESLLTFGGLLVGQSRTVPAAVPRISKPNKLGDNG